MLALTLVTILMIPPQVIGGIMGMNVFVPGQGGVEDESYFAFAIIILVIVILMLLIALVLKKTRTCDLVN